MARCLPLLLAAVAAALPSAVHAAPGAPTGLRAEYLTNPVGLDVAQPRLSWKLPAGRDGLAQSGWQVQVASSRERLLRGRADRWDSGRVNDDRSHLVPYSGRALAARDQCWWRVRYWDQEGRGSTWSEPARWTMGLLGPDDWRGKWIGAQPTPPPGAEAAGWGAAQWVWLAGGPADATEERAPGTVYFYREFEVPAGVERGELLISVDDTFTVWLDGDQVGQNAHHGEAWRVPQRFDVGERLGAGRHVLVVMGNNLRQSPAGLLALLRYTTAAGTTVELPSDAQWLASAGEPGQRPPDARPAWPAAQVLAAYGQQPWGSLPVAGEQTAEALSPQLRREFNVRKPVAQAELSICGLGYHEVFLDGAKLGDAVLEPGPTIYDKLALYVTHDVTRALRPGRHALGVQLAQGQFNQWVADSWDFEQAPWRAEPRMLLQLDVVYTDGSRDSIVSDERWTYAAGPITYDQTRVGVSYDARRETPGWTKPGYRGAGWQPVAVVDAVTTNLRAQRGQPVRVTKNVPVAKWSQPQAGVWVADLGRNFAGWCRLSVAGPAGTKITLAYSELRGADGMINQANIAPHVRNPVFQTDTFTLAGTGAREVFEPRFTYHGFQYVEVRGLPGPPDVQTLMGRQVRSDMKRAGRFDSSNPLLQQILDLGYWSYESNFVSFPLDCPHREKNGWTGDAQLIAETGLTFYDSAAEYSRWLDDMAVSQREDGKLPCIIPTAGWGYNVLDGPAWEGAYSFIADDLHVYQGDRRVLAQHYDGLKRWVDYYVERAQDGVIKYGLGDWCPWEATTPAEITSTGYVYQAARIVESTARLFGHEEDAAKYAQVAEDLKAAFIEQYYDEANNSIGPGTQTALATALYHGLLPPGKAQAMADRLAEMVRANGGHLDFGIIGSKFVPRVLCDYGHADVAYGMVDRTSQPSWGWWLTQGATTMWENWWAGASHNHIMFGDIMAWFNQYLAGIRPDREQPGYQHFVIAPQIVGDLTWVRGEHESPYGQIVVGWTRDGDQVTLTAAIPPNSTARFDLPRNARWHEGSGLSGRSLILRPGERQVRFRVQ